MSQGTTESISVVNQVTVRLQESFNKLNFNIFPCSSTECSALAEVSAFSALSS